DLAFMRLVQERTVDLDSSIDRWLRSWHLHPSDAARSPTARMIMSHHAGFNVDSVGSYPAGGAIPTLPHVLDSNDPSQTPAVRLSWPPGDSFHYSGGGLSVLQQALVDTTGEQFDVLVKRLVLGPLQMRHSTFSQSNGAWSRFEVAHGHAWDGRPW